MKRTISASLAFVSAGFFACGGGAPLDLEIEAPPSREARVALTPALDVTGLAHGEFIERLVIEEIAISLADVRLLGANPRLPAGGLPLLSAPQVAAADPTSNALELPFPAAFLSDEDLAVYLRLQPSAALENASVVVRARLYSNPVHSEQQSLTVKGTEMGSTDPDVDPARGYVWRDCSTDPDVDPADCPEPRRRFLKQALIDELSVPFELRDDRDADLVASLVSGDLDVVVGMRAERWLTPEVVARLESALAQVQERAHREGHQRVLEESVTREPIVVEALYDRGVNTTNQERMAANQDYTLGDREQLHRGTVRRD